VTLVRDIARTYVYAACGIPPKEYPPQLLVLYSVFVAVYLLVGTLKFMAFGNDTLFSVAALSALLLIVASIFGWKGAVSYTLISVVSDIVRVSLFYTDLYVPLSNTAWFFDAWELLALISCTTKTYYREK